ERMRTPIKRMQRILTDFFIYIKKSSQLKDGGKIMDFTLKISNLPLFNSIKTNEFYQIQNQNY
ncbi:hypothetical protein JXJ21_08140, partial [candidate division KSB1 bacterium]|nr:hypothetical protein [candidate division KSB1 bacterium]